VMCSAGILPAVVRAFCPDRRGRDAPATAAGTAALRILPRLDIKS
jgi:hypothetical protein